MEITIQNIQRISLREISGSESESESKYCIDWIHLDKNTKHLLLLLRAKTLLSLNSKLTQGHRLTLSVKIYTKKTRSKRTSALTHSVSILTAYSGSKLKIEGYFVCAAWWP